MCKFAYGFSTGILLNISIIYGIRDPNFNISIALFYRELDWFNQDLPEYLFPEPTENDTSIIDMETIRDVCEVRFSFIEMTFNHF